MLYAEVDWRNVHSGKDLHTVDVEWICVSEDSTYADSAPTGTRITLSGLRTAWDGKAIEELGGDIWMLRSPFRLDNGRRKGKTALDFYVDLIAPGIDDAKKRFDKLRDALFDNWMARITGVLEDGRHPHGRNRASVSVEFAPDYPKGGKGSGPIP